MTLDVLICIFSKFETKDMRFNSVYKCLLKIFPFFSSLIESLELIDNNIRQGKGLQKTVGLCVRVCVCVGV